MPAISDIIKNRLETGEPLPKAEYEPVSKSRRRRVDVQKKGGDRLSDIDQHKIELSRFLTAFSCRVCQEVEKSDRFGNVEDLADTIGRSHEYMHRLLGGGIDVSTDTIAEIENEFGKITENLG